MAEVTEVRESGIEILNGEVEGVGEDVTDTALVRLPEPTDLTVDETVGKEIQIRDVEFIGAASIDDTRVVGGMEAAMMGLDPENGAEIAEEHDEITGFDEETGEFEMEVDQAALFIAAEDGEAGVGLIQTESAGIEDVLSEFEDDYL